MKLTLGSTTACNKKLFDKVCCWDDLILVTNRSLCNAQTICWNKVCCVGWPGSALAVLEGAKQPFGRGHGVAATRRWELIFWVREIGCASFPAIIVIFKIFSMWKMSIKNDIVVVFSSVVLSTVNQWGFSIKFCVLHWASVLLKHLCSRLVLLSPIPFQLTLSQQNHSVTPVLILNNPLYVHC